MLIGTLVDPGLPIPPDPRLRRRQVLVPVSPGVTKLAADCFLDSRTEVSGLVGAAYRQLESQTNRQFARLTDPRGPYRFSVVPTCQQTPYEDASGLTASVLATRTLEVTTAPADRMHPLLDGAVGGAYFRFRAVHDLIGHVATGFGFDADGEYSAWLFQRDFYRGLGRWAAATELHGEISALWTTGQFVEHKAALLDPVLLHPGVARHAGPAAHVELAASGCVGQPGVAPRRD
jgi:hypothetical protein